MPIDYFEQRESSPYYRAAKKTSSHGELKQAKPGGDGQPFNFEEA